MRLAFALGAALALAAPVSAQSFSPQPWLDDLAQAQAAFHQKYANLDWLQQDRGVDLDALFGRAAAALRQAGSDADARMVFDRLVQRVADGHVEIRWPRTAPPVAPTPPTTAAPQNAAAPPADPCAALGYNDRQDTPGIAPRLPGYQPVGAAGDGFAAGTVPVAGHTVGAIRIPVFQPQAKPQFCRAALVALKVADKPCDDACRDAVETWIYTRMTEGLEAQLRALRAAGATTLLIDLTGNGGGSEWAEAAARIVTPMALRSEARGYVRGEHWAANWRDLAANLREVASTSKTLTAGDRIRLAAWAGEADAAARDAAAPCARGASCPRTARHGFATGLVGQAEPGLASKDWAPLVFSPASYPWHPGVWQGPVIVLVDDDTASAAEEFAAVLQDNHAALIMGARTAGAGCGHTNSGTPTRLAHSGAVLQLPDCIRYRADGSNEVGGILPDLLVAIRANDGPAFKAKLVADKLPAALAAAVR